MVLFTLTRLMAPFTPFITEHIYQNLKKAVKKSDNVEFDESIHYLMNPEVQYVLNLNFIKHCLF